MRRFALSLPFLMLAAACGGETASAPETGATGPCAGATGDSVVVVDAWVRAAAPERTMSAAYLTLCNPAASPDALVAAEAAIAETVELHETVRDDAGVARMAQVAEIPVGAGGEAHLAPGGAHIMLIGLTGPIAEGETVPLTLVFSSGASVTVDAVARGGGSGGH